MGSWSINWTATGPNWRPNGTFEPVPSEDNAVDLGSPTKRFKSVHAVSVISEDIKNSEGESLVVAGAASGPAEAKAGNITTFADSSGKVLEDSDVAIDDVVLHSGGSVSGNIPTFSGTGGNLVEDSNIATADILLKSGGTMSGHLDMNEKNVYGVGFMNADSITTLELNSVNSIDTSGPISANRIALGLSARTEYLYSRNSVSLCSATDTDWAGGDRVIGIGNAAGPPLIPPVGGGVLYCDNGALKWMGTGGTITTIALA